MILLTEGATMERLFNLDWQLLSDFTLTLIAVFVLFFFMSFLFFNPARKVLNNRKEKIKGELDEAETNMESAKALKAEYEDKLKNIDKETEIILSEARKKALENEKEIVERAREEANRILERARTEATLEKQKMSDDVKKEIIEVASAMAGKIVAAKIDTSVSSQLIDETLKEMGEDTWLS